MVEGLFYHHRYPVSAYSYGKDDNSSYRRNIESLTGSGFVDLVSLGHHEAVAAVRHTGAHIVVDLQGYTLGTRSELTALRLAPIQVSKGKEDLSYVGVLHRLYWSRIYVLS